MQLSQRQVLAARWVAVALILTALILLGRLLPLQDLAATLEEWISGLGHFGPVIFVALYVLATVLFVPGIVLTVAAGAIFGILLGTILVSLGSTLGAAAAFLIARYLARRQVADLVRRRPRLAAIDAAIGEGGWRIVALLRLSPVVPFNLQNYLYGLTPVGFGRYVLASWIAMLPGTVMYVYIGHVTGTALAGGRERSWIEWMLLGAGLLATIAVSIYVTILARRKLREQKVLPPESEPSPETPETAVAIRGFPWGTAALCGVALLLVAAAGCAQLRPETSRKILGRLFGAAPEVELRETYEASESDGPGFDHSLLDELLARHVNERGGVDYEALAQQREQLQRYIGSLADAPMDEMSRDERLALLINAYNAFTLELILEHYPLEEIKDIPAGRRWKDRRWKVGGHTWSLDDIEHKQIRPNFREPRIHFALVCAAVGCPPLRRNAYSAVRLEEQLEEQARYVHEHPRWFRYDPDRDRVWLTSLYRWYGGDFEQVAGSVLAYAARYNPDLKTALESGQKPDVTFLDYDWSLNSAANVPPAEN